jgi:hypothetical protein
MGRWKLRWELIQCGYLSNATQVRVDPGICFARLLRKSSIFLNDYVMARSLLIIALLIVMIGCSNESARTPLSPSTLRTDSLSIVPPSDELTSIGGLSLDGYCQSLGYASSTLSKLQVGPNAAFNNWRCQDVEGGLHLFSMERACQWQWGTNAIQARPSTTLLDSKLNVL